jgi:hypothetical protein
MWMLNLFLALLLQSAPSPMTVVVGLLDGQKVLVVNPEFSGFIRGGRNENAVLLYRQHSIHGRMPLSAISRIGFGAYKRGLPFTMIVTLKNGQTLEVESEVHDFVTLKGDTDLGPVLIKHPDPVAAPLRVSTRKLSRARDLTILYLEFPTS